MKKMTDCPEIEIAAVKPFDQGKPHINGPSVYGASPNCFFLYYIPVRGERPMKLHVQGELPPGLTLGKGTGIIEGQAEKEGIWKVIITASNRLGTDTKEFRIEIAKDRLARTPLLGWTSWNAHSVHVRDEHIYRAADLLCTTGLREFGYSYVNIDSGWQGTRASETSALQPNRFFRDMRDLTEYIHCRGLKAGIYSTPMVHAWGSSPGRPALFGSTGYPLNQDMLFKHFGGCGTVHFEEYDARQWADWGFDYLKYDWPKCDPYYTRCMSKAIRNSGRDFVYSLTTGCTPEYMDTYRECANMMRVNGDTLDDWEERILRWIFPDDAWHRFTGPGHWLDMDMLALGDISGITNSLWNRLTRNEQITHMAVWAFMTSPIQLSCDLSRIDPLSMALFTNEELLEINQDELGSGAVEESADGNARVFTRKLFRGDEAAAFINAENETAELVLKRPGKSLKVRDVPAQKELGEFADEVRFRVPAHGTRIIRFSEK